MLAMLAGACLLAVYPDDSYSRPAVDYQPVFETLSGVQPAGNPVSRQADYELNTLRAVQLDGAPWGLWRFVAKPDRGAVLSFHDRVRRRPSLVTVRVRNRGSVEARFVVSLPELAWQPPPAEPTMAWIVAGDAPVAAGEERVVRFDLAALVASPPGPRGEPVFPTSINLHVGPVTAGVEYALALREWTIHYPAAAGVSVTRLSAPTELTPRRPATFAVAATGVADDDRVDLELRDEPLTMWRIRLTGDEVRALAAGGVEITRDVPWFLPATATSLGLVVDGYRATGATATVRVAAQPAAGFPRVERRPHQGRPTVFVEGRPLTWGGYASYEYEPGGVSEFGASGANLMCLTLCAGRHVHQVAAPTWVAPDAYDYRQVDERICLALQANPDAYLLPRVNLSLPSVWLQEHPDSIVRIRTPAGDVEWEETGALAASIASEEWQRQQEACLRDLIAHLAAQPYASRIIGFMPTGQVTEEWFAWGCNDGLWGDYSPATKAAFAAWCAGRGQPWTSLPEPAERQAPGHDWYPPTDSGRRAAAYAQFCSDLSADVIARFCRVVKQATDGRCLAGTFYGYVIQLAGEPRQATAGQFAVRRLLECPEFDLIAGIPLHNFRTLANGYDLFCSATESVLAAGRIIVNENDLFSWLHHALWYQPYDPTDPRGAAIAMHRRNLANSLVHGAELQWFSLLASWHHDAELQAEFARQIAWQARGVEFDRAPTEEIAFVVDDTGFAWRPPETKLTWHSHIAGLYHLGRTGAPVGVWLLRDVDRLPERIKLVLMADATAPRPEDLAALRRLIDRGGRTIVVTGAPGLIDPVAQRWDVAAPAAVCGLPLRVEADGGPGDAAIERVTPRCVATEPGWRAYADGAGAGLERPLADGGRLIWSGLPVYDPALLRVWAESAGVLPPAPLGYTVHASRQLVAVTAPQAGDATLRWPRPARVLDLFDGWTASGAEFGCPFTTGQTRLFVVEE